MQGGEEGDEIDSRDLGGIGAGSARSGGAMQ